MNTNIQRAEDYATRAHAGQVRKYVNEPYVEHPKRVAARVACVPGMDEAAVIAALLHDTVEDTDVTLADVEREFGAEVAALVDALTDKYTPQSHPGLNRKTRKALEAERLAAIPRAAKIIKLADIADNLRGTDPADSFTDVFLKEKGALLPLIHDGDAALALEVEEAARTLTWKRALLVAVRKHETEQAKAKQAESGAP